jgi:hypothetical protein
MRLAPGGDDLIADQPETFFQKTADFASRVANLRLHMGQRNATQGTETMTKATHQISWIADMVNAKGEAKRFRFSKYFVASEWDEAREAAIFFFFNDDKDFLASEGWHLTAPASIQVLKVSPLSDVALA